MYMSKAQLRRKTGEGLGLLQFRFDGVLILVKCS
jgi:hypothetical protein